MRPFGHVADRRATGPAVGLGAGGDLVLDRLLARQNEVEVVLVGVDDDRAGASPVGSAIRLRTIGIDHSSGGASAIIALSCGLRCVSSVAVCVSIGEQPLSIAPAANATAIRIPLPVMCPPAASNSQSGNHSEVVYPFSPPPDTDCLREPPRSRHPFVSRGPHFLVAVLLRDGDDADNTNSCDGGRRGSGARPARRSVGEAARPALQPLDPCVTAVARAKAAAAGRSDRARSTARCGRARRDRSSDGRRPRRNRPATDPDRAPAGATGRELLARRANRRRSARHRRSSSRRRGSRPQHRGGGDQLVLEGQRMDLEGAARGEARQRFAGEGGAFGVGVERRASARPSSRCSQRRGSPRSPTRRRRGAIPGRQAPPGDAAGAPIPCAAACRAAPRSSPSRRR